jgi:hypothetical protein
MIVRRDVGAFRVFIGSNAMAPPLFQQCESSNWGRDGLDRVIKLWEWRLSEARGSNQLVTGRIPKTEDSLAERAEFELSGDFISGQ